MDTPWMALMMLLRTAKRPLEVKYLFFVPNYINGCLTSVFFVAAKSLVGPRYNSEIDPTARKFLKENMPKPEV